MKNEIFESMYEIVTFLNDPRNDEQLLRKAGLKNDKNLLPIIVRIGRQPKMNVGELANQLGRNHSSLSRQIDKFVSLGLVESSYNEQDKRIREVELSEEGYRIFEDISKARDEIMERALKDLTDSEIEEISWSLKKVAELLKKD
jgi:DNA-binding MarR family transcriptional regulator